MMSIEKDRKAVGSAFPKKCGACGKVYPNLKSFMNETTALITGSLSQGPKESVLSYRNCKCGSTITIKVQDLRDNSKEGEAQRELFRKKLLAYQESGLSDKEAMALVRKELGLD